MDIKRRFKGRDLLSLIRELTYLILNPDTVYELVIREYKERRSLKANNYSSSSVKRKCTQK